MPPQTDGIKFVSGTALLHPDMAQRFVDGRVRHNHWTDRLASRIEGMRLRARSAKKFGLHVSHSALST